MNLFFEINTRVWLKQLSTRYDRSVTLANIPEAEFQQLEKLGFQAV